MEKGSSSTTWLGWANVNLGGCLIKNLGAPVETNDAVRLPVRRNDLEYLTVDIPFVYLMAIGKVAPASDAYEFLLTTDSFADRSIESIVGWPAIATLQVARYIDSDNYYFNRVDTTAVTADHKLYKIVAGTWTELGYEAIDLYENNYGPFKLRCIGTTIESYRWDLVTPKISVTDVELASGLFGGLTIHPRGNRDSGFHPFTAYLRGSPQTSQPKVIAYFEVPVIGKGTEKDPYRVQMPEELTPDRKRNLLALSHSSLIPCDRATGKPLHGTAFVRIFEQPDRDSALRDIATCLDALRAMSGVTELTLDDAKLLAKRLDDRLRDGEIEYMLNPTEPNELWALSDFYERAVIDLKRIDPTKISGFDMLMEGYAKRSEEIGRTDLADKFRALRRR